MGRFGVAAILAALCSALCLYGSRGKRRRLQYAARIKSKDTFGPRTMGSLLCSMLRVNTPGRDDHSSVLRRVGCVSGGSSSNDFERPEIKTEVKSRMLKEIKTEDQGFRLDEVGDHKIKTEDQGTRLELAAGANLCQLVQKIKEAFGGWNSDLCRLQIRSGFKESSDGLLAFESFVSTDLSTSPRYTASEEAFNNSVLVQGRVVPPSALKLRSAGAREDSEALYQGCRESPGSATNLARENCSGSGTRIQDHKVVDEQMLLWARPCKRRVRRLRSVLLEAQHDQVRSVRLGAGSHSTVTCRTTDGTVRRGSNSGCTVFGTLSARQRRQAAAISVRRAQQDERYIRPKDNGFLALLPTGRSR